MADNRTVSIPAETVKLLEDLNVCLNEVHSRLDSQKDSRYVTRFSEKNQLTHRCMLQCVFWNLCIDMISGEDLILVG